MSSGPDTPRAGFLSTKELIDFLDDDTDILSDYHNNFTGEDEYMHLVSSSKQNYVHGSNGYNNGYNNGESNSPPGQNNGGGLFLFFAGAEGGGARGDKYRRYYDNGYRGEGNDGKLKRMLKTILKRGGILVCVCAIVTTLIVLLGFGDRVKGLVNRWKGVDIKTISIGEGVDGNSGGVSGDGIAGAGSGVNVTAVKNNVDAKKPDYLGADVGKNEKTSDKSLNLAKHVEPRVESPLQPHEAPILQSIDDYPTPSTETMTNFDRAHGEDEGQIQQLQKKREQREREERQEREEREKERKERGQEGVEEKEREETDANENKVLTPFWNPDGTPSNADDVEEVKAAVNKENKQSSKEDKMVGKIRDAEAEASLSDEELKVQKPSHYVNKVIAENFKKHEGHHEALAENLQPLPRELQPQPETTVPQERVDYDYHFDWPDTSSMTENEIVLTFCSGINGRHKARRIRIYMLNSAYPQYMADCMAAMFKRFRGTDPNTGKVLESKVLGSSTSSTSDSTSNIVDPDPSRPRLAWGDFAQLNFMYPDGKEVTHSLAGGFATATLSRGGSSSSYRTDGVPDPDTVDLHQIRTGVGASHERIPGSLTWYVTEVNYEKYGTAKKPLKKDETPKTVDGEALPEDEDDGEVILSEMIVHHGRVGLEDTSDLKTASPDGVGVWMVQTTEDFEGQSACAGPMLFAFDFMFKYRDLSFLAHMKRIAILDASWSYLPSRSTGAPLLDEDKEKWFKRTAPLRNQFHILADPNSTQKQKLEARAWALENGKTPGRNCYLYPYMSGRPEFQKLTRLLAEPDQCIKKWGGSEFPNMNSPGRFPGVIYYMYDLPPRKGTEGGMTQGGGAEASAFMSNNNNNKGVSKGDMNLSSSSSSSFIGLGGGLGEAGSKDHVVGEKKVGKWRYGKLFTSFVQEEAGLDKDEKVGDGRINNRRSSLEGHWDLHMGWVPNVKDSSNDRGVENVNGDYFRADFSPV